MNKNKYSIWKKIVLGLLFAALSLFLYAIVTADNTPPPLWLDSRVYQDSGLPTLLQKLQYRIHEQPFNLAALIIFVLSITHTFFCHRFNQLSDWIVEKNTRKYGVHTETFASEFFRFMGEIEVVFGVWVIPLMIVLSQYYDWHTAVEYLNSRQYAEPIFVVVIMALASTAPVLRVAENVMRLAAKIGGESIRAWWLALLSIGPFLGSFITEPAAMTLTALLLSKQFYKYRPSPLLAYGTLGLLFTNISVGGVLTNFAAPPVLMVSRVWEWSSMYMFSTFGYKAIVGVLIANVVYFVVFYKEFQRMQLERSKKIEEERKEKEIPLWITFVHFVFLFLVVTHVHYPVIVLGAFLFFLGFYKATETYQEELKLRNPILVGFFLAGLVVHGGLQGWWISPLLSTVSAQGLMVVSTILTAFNDNAAITYLTTFIPSFDAMMKYAVVAGAVTGGGLTIIANAPNPAGAAILGEHFEHGISFVWLFLGALLPTLIVGVSFYVQGLL